MKYIRTKYGEILELEKTSKCIYSIRNKNVDSKNCYVSYLWDNWKEYYLVDYKSCMLFSYNSAQSFISDLIKENLNYQDLVIELSPYYKECRQAYTPEGLCDEFRYKYDDAPVDGILFDHQKCWKKMSDGKWYDYVLDTELSEEEVSTIRGGIWTDEGLKYVIKMNKDGGFDLI